MFVMEGVKQLVVINGDLYMNNQKENMLLMIDDDISDVKEISVTEYNQTVINSIQFKYPHLRQSSKAP